MRKSPEFHNDIAMDRCIFQSLRIAKCLVEQLLFETRPDQRSDQKYSSGDQNDGPMAENESGCDQLSEHCGIDRMTDDTVNPGRNEPVAFDETRL